MLEFNSIKSKFKIQIHKANIRLMCINCIKGFDKKGYQTNQISSTSNILLLSTKKCDSAHSDFFLNLYPKSQFKRKIEFLSVHSSFSISFWSGRCQRFFCICCGLFEYIFSSHLIVPNQLRPIPVGNHTHSDLAITSRIRLAFRIHLNRFAFDELSMSWVAQYLHSPHEFSITANDVV